MLTINEKLWDKVRPKKVKKTGVSGAIRQTLKLIPGGKIDKLKKGADIDAASNQLQTLLRVLKKAKSLVAKEDTDKKATKQLDAWIKQTEMALKALVQKNAGQAEAMGEVVIKLWGPKLKKWDSTVVGIVQGFANCEKNQGSAEGIMQEAEMEMIRRAGELKERGATGESPQDFIKDADFKSAFREWSTQVDKWIKSGKEYETLAKQAQALGPDIDEMKKAVDDAATTGADGKTFLTFKRDVDAFYKNTRTDSPAKSYQRFRFIQTTTPSSSFRAESEKAFLNRFRKMKKVDAESYMQEELAKHGFNEKQMAKTHKEAKALDAAVTSAAKEVQTLFGKTDKNYKADAERFAELMKTITRTSDELVKIDAQLKRGRRNQIVANQLSLAVNAKYKKIVEKVMADVEGWSERSRKAVQAVKSIARKTMA